MHLRLIPTRSQTRRRMRTPDELQQILTGPDTAHRRELEVLIEEHARDADRAA